MSRPKPLLWEIDHSKLRIPKKTHLARHKRMSCLNHLVSYGSHWKPQTKKGPTQRSGFREGETRDGRSCLRTERAQYTLQSWGMPGGCFEDDFCFWGSPMSTVHFHCGTEATCWSWILPGSHFRTVALRERRRFRCSQPGRWATGLNPLTWT